MKKFILLLLSCVVVTCLNAQPVNLPLYNGTNSYSLVELTASAVTRDTITDAGTGVLTSKRVNGPGTTTIEVYVTKVSGTVAGTLTLQGSLDGTNFKAINTSETQTALATVALTDATNSYSWRLPTCPYLYYRVSATGGTTTVYYLNARILKH